MNAPRLSGPWPFVRKHGHLLVVFLIILTASYHITARSEDPMSAARDMTRDFFVGQAGYPVQYRILSQYLLLWIARVQGIDLASYSLAPYTALRFIQAAVLLSVAYVYYGRLGIQPRTRILGLALITGIVTVNLGERGPSTMSLDRVTDTIFYLVGGLLVTSGLGLLLPALMLLAILNRETSGLLPMLLVAKYGRGLLSRSGGPALLACLAAWGVWGVVFFGLRALYQAPPWHEPGFGAMFFYSLRHAASGAWFFAMASLTPLLAVVSLRVADGYLRRLFWLIVPVWVFIHFGQARYYEGMMYLAPTTLILIPLLLQGVERLMGIGETRERVTAVTAPLEGPRPAPAFVASAPAPQPQAGQ